MINTWITDEKSKHTHTALNINGRFHAETMPTFQKRRGSNYKKNNNNEYYEHYNHTVYCFSAIHEEMFRGKPCFSCDLLSTLGSKSLCLQEWGAVPCAQWFGSAHGPVVQSKQPEGLQLQRETDQEAKSGNHGLGCLPGAGQPLYWVGEGGRYCLMCCSKSSPFLIYYFIYRSGKYTGIKVNIVWIPQNSKQQTAPPFGMWTWANILQPSGNLSSPTCSNINLVNVVYEASLLQLYVICSMALERAGVKAHGAVCFFFCCTLLKETYVS